MKPLTLVCSYFPSSCLLFLLVSSFCTICFCNQNSNHVQCIPTERLALLDLKNNLTDPTNRLFSWVGRDCCTWSGVVCDNVTGHVHEIHLRGRDHGLFNTDVDIKEASKHTLGGTISPSIINLSQLTYLDLSFNDFGSMPIPTFIGSFQNLIYLNVSYSNFSGEIPHQLGNLSKLHFLDLHKGPYSGMLYSESLKWLQNLKMLRYLDMSESDLTKASDWFPVISNLTSLLKLYLSSCQLNQLPSNATTDGFTSLIVLDLSSNFFVSNIMLPGWLFKLHNLVLLDLTSCRITGVNPGIHDGFHSMPSLRTLRVSFNTFMNSSSLLNGLSSLSNLQVLDVSYCDISSPILSDIQNLPLLVHLDLSGNHIAEVIPKSLSNLCNLTTLDLSFNNFSGNVSELLQRFCECELPKVELLNFGNNYLIGQLPKRLGKLKSLVSIDLSYNHLIGTIPDSIGSLSSLKILCISSNQLSGSIPDTIGDLPSINILDLSYNMLNGSIPESIGRLSELSFLTLNHNSLTGFVTENHFANLTALKILSVGDNKLVFELNVNNWIPPFKLTKLIADSCSLGPRFPSWVRSQTDLRELDVANTNISDTIPNWIWTTFSSLEFLNVSYNNIQGKLGAVTFLARGAVLDLSNNHLHGMLPGDFNEANMGFLDLSNNNLSGSLIQFLCSGNHELQQLKYLSLANNNMSGIIPDCWTSWQSLIILNLERNQFSGIVPPSLGNLSHLKSLDMDDNKLSGNLPSSLLNSNSLVVIELARNELTGRIPSLIGRNNTSLRVLSLRSNKIEGKFPNEACRLKSVQILDLAHNDLSGNLPTCFTDFSVISRSEASNLIFLYKTINTPIITTASLVTKSNMYTYSTILYQVTSLDLSSNKFSGPIPNELIELLGLRFLNLSHNDLTGIIPNLFNKICKLESLDLSMNYLSGNIPLSLSQLAALNFLNVSYNNLEGIIPAGPQFQTFSESSFGGNALCGDPLPTCFQNNNDTKGSDKGHDSTDWILVIITLVGFIIGFWVMVIPLFLSRRWRNAYYHFLDQVWFNLQISSFPNSSDHISSLLQNADFMSHITKLIASQKAPNQVEEDDSDEGDE